MGTRKQFEWTANVLPIRDNLPLLLQILRHVRTNAKIRSCGEGSLFMPRPYREIRQQAGVPSWEKAGLTLTFERRALWLTIAYLTDKELADSLEPSSDSPGFKPVLYGRGEWKHTQNTPVTVSAGAAAALAMHKASAPTHSCCPHTRPQLQAPKRV